MILSDGDGPGLKIPTYIRVTGLSHWFWEGQHLRQGHHILWERSQGSCLQHQSSPTFTQQRQGLPLYAKCVWPGPDITFFQGHHHWLQKGSLVCWWKPKLHNWNIQIFISCVWINKLNSIQVCNLSVFSHIIFHVVLPYLVLRSLLMIGRTGNLEVIQPVWSCTLLTFIYYSLLQAKTRTRFSNTVSRYQDTEPKVRRWVNLKYMRHYVITLLR